jgi:16S rRNA processing protein RimM
LIVIGCFGKAFGIKGWIKVISFTTPQENILKFKPWIIKSNDLWKEVYIENSRKHFASIIVKLPNYNSPEEVRHFTNLKIGIWRQQLPKLRVGKYYWVDLIGLNVINDNNINLGVVKDLIATGSNDVLVVVDERKRLIPYLSHVVLSIDLDSKIIHVAWEKDFL